MFNKPVLVVMLVCMILLPVACNPSPPGLPSTQPNSNKPQNSKVIAPIPSSSQITERLAAKSKDGGAAKASEDEEEARPLLRVYLQPLGDSLPRADVAYIQQALNVFYPLDVVELPPSPLPNEAYYAPRARYRAEKLLTKLTELAPSDSHVIIGLTAVDISTTKGQHHDWGILGLASVGGGECVVSRFRAQSGARDEQHTRERLAKTVVHEVGHTLGLRHCPQYGCLMEDRRGTVTTTDHEYDLCDQCRGLLAENAKGKADDLIPWSKP